MVECLSDVSNLFRTRRISTEKTDHLFAAQNSGDQNSGLRISGVSCRSHHTPPSFSWSKGRPGPGGCQGRAAGAPGFAWSQILDSLLYPGKVVTMRSTAGNGAGGAASRWSSREARIRGQIRIPRNDVPPSRFGRASPRSSSVPFPSDRLQLRAGARPSPNPGTVTDFTIYAAVPSSTGFFRGRPGRPGRRRRPVAASRRPRKAASPSGRPVSAWRRKRSSAASSYAAASSADEDWPGHRSARSNSGAAAHNKSFPSARWARARPGPVLRPRH